MIPLFPLQLVVYPGERLALHIFEERYQQLIKDCENEGFLFGIPAYIDNKLEYGTEVALQKIEKRYPGGESDIVCIGTRVFKINRFYEKSAGKLYSDGEVLFLENDDHSSVALQEELLVNIEILYTALTLDKAPIVEIPFTSYQVAHKVGLAVQQEYHLLSLRTELERLAYLLEHLKTTIPVIREINRTKDVIKMNGHFKKFDPLDFKDFEL